MQMTTWRAVHEVSLHPFTADLESEAWQLPDTRDFVSVVVQQRAEPPLFCSLLFSDDAAFGRDGIKF
jgi:hypothetical protein